MQPEEKSSGDVLAVSLDGAIVRGERNLLSDTATGNMEGARAALETFYYAFNTRSLDLLRKIWADDPLAQVVTPLVNHVRGIANINAVYDRMKSTPMPMSTVLDDIVMYFTPGLAVFTERERATSSNDSHASAEELSGRSVCIFHFMAKKGGWRLIYHQVSLDNKTQQAIPDRKEV
jgi:SnoaL-like domain